MRYGWQSGRIPRLVIGSHPSFAYVLQQTGFNSKTREYFYVYIGQTTKRQNKKWGHVPWVVYSGRVKIESECERDSEVFLFDECPGVSSVQMWVSARHKRGYVTQYSNKERSGREAI